MAGKIGLQDTEYDPDIHNEVDFDFFDEDENPYQAKTIKASSTIEIIADVVVNKTVETNEIIEAVENIEISKTVENSDIVKTNENNSSVIEGPENVDAVENACKSAMSSLESACNVANELQESFTLLTVNQCMQNELQCGNTENDDSNSDDSVSESEQYSDSSFECDEQCTNQITGEFCGTAKVTENNQSFRKDSLDLQSNVDPLDSIESSPETDTESIKSKPTSRFKEIVKLHQWTPTPDSSRTYVNTSRTASARRRKNMSFSNEEVRRIDRENMILLRRIFEQQRLREKPKPTVPKLKSFLPKTVQQRKIDRENALLLRKIKSAKPSNDIASAFGADRM